MTSVSTLAQPRSDAERADPALACQRTDEAFLASGTCHILAFTFRDRHPDRDLVLRPIETICADLLHGALRSFTHDPRPRAEACLDRFPARPSA